MMTSSWCLLTVSIYYSYQSDLNLSVCGLWMLGCILTTAHIASVDASVGNRLDFHNQSSVWPNQSMIDCIIGSWDAILIISAHERWDEGLISTITPLGIEIKICLIQNVDVVSYRRHCDICANFSWFDVNWRNFFYSEFWLIINNSTS